VKIAEKSDRGREDELWLVDSDFPIHPGREGVLQQRGSHHSSREAERKNACATSPNSEKLPVRVTNFLSAAFGKIKSYSETTWTEAFKMECVWGGDDSSCCLE
jgi:hypothetical protein